MLYLKKFKLRNIRCFPELTIEPTASRRSILITGDNGNGKSTLLKSLAMGLCDPTSAGALHRELPGELVRHGEDEGQISVSLADRQGRRYEIETTFEQAGATERIVPKRRRSPRIDPFEKVFVSGYGAGLRTDASSDFEYYLPIDAVYPLFNYSTTLQNPELIVRRYLAPTTLAKSSRSQRSNGSREERLAILFDFIEDVLGFSSEQALELTPRGIFIKRGDDLASLGSQGDGHQSVITWLLDLIGWWLLFLQHKEKQPTVDSFESIAGIVIFDEIEQHLHPKWQLSIIGKLVERLPNVQFIMTTHSPLVLSGGAEYCDIYRLTGVGEGAELQYNEGVGWLAEDVYTEIMDLKSSRPHFIRELEKEYEALIRRKHLEGPLSLKDKNRIAAIRRTFAEKLPGTDPLNLVAELRALNNLDSPPEK